MPATILYRSIIVILSETTLDNSGFTYTIQTFLNSDLIAEFTAVTTSRVLYQDELVGINRIELTTQGPLSIPFCVDSILAYDAYFLNSSAYTVKYIYWAADDVTGGKNDFNLFVLKGQTMQIKSVKADFSKNDCLKNSEGNTDNIADDTDILNIKI
jgi:hypothetical protein